MKKSNGANLIKSIQQDIDLMNGPNWEYLTLATRTKIEYRYKGKCHKLYHLFKNGVIEPMVAAVRVIADFIVQMIYAIGNIFEQIGKSLKQSNEPIK